MSVLQRFKSLPVVREVCRENSLPDVARGYGRDTITLGWEERLKARGRRTSDSGFEFGTALPRGTILRAGDAFVLGDASRVITVLERREAVLVITPSSSHEWGLFAYHIGNNHQPMMIDGGAIVCPDVPGLQQVLEQHNMRFSRAMRSFTPVGALPDHRH